MSRCVTAGVVALAALGACQGKRSGGEATEHALPNATQDTEAEPEPAAGPVAARTTQLIVGVSEDWNDPAVDLVRYEREPGGAWRAVGEAWRGNLGRAGLGWGRGAHGDGAPAGRGGPVKVEGDGKSPAGAFAIVDAYGYAAAAEAESAIEYTQVTESWKCVDDPASQSYNRILDSNAVAGGIDWSSAEEMRRDDDLYEYVIVIDHNPARTPRSGSCIFFHVWSGAGGATAGCTSVSRARMRELLAWLDPDAAPMYVVLPREEHAALREAWRLP